MTSTKKTSTPPPSEEGGTTIAFLTPIIDLDGEKIREVKMQPNGRPRTRMVPLDFPSVDIARRSGYDAFEHDGRPHVIEPELLEIDLRRVCISALSRTWPDEQASAMETMERWLLAQRIASACDDPSKMGRIRISEDDRQRLLHVTRRFGSGANAMPVYFVRAHQLLGGTPDDLHEETPAAPAANTAQPAPPPGPRH